MMAALKIAGDLITLKNAAPETDAQSATSGTNSEDMIRLQTEIKSLEAQVDALMQTLSLPGSPRPIVP